MRLAIEQVHAGRGGLDRGVVQLGLPGKHRVDARLSVGADHVREAAAPKVAVNEKDFLSAGGERLGQRVRDRGLALVGDGGGDADDVHRVIHRGEPDICDEGLDGVLEKNAVAGALA